MKGGGLEAIEAIRYAIELGMTHLTSSMLGMGRFGLHPLFFEGLALGRVSGHYPYPSPGLGVTGIIKCYSALFKRCATVRLA